MRLLPSPAIVLLFLGFVSAPHAAELAATLDNGLRVVVRPLPDRSLVDVEIFFAAGSAVEPDSLAGLAHLTEHLVCRYGAGPDAGAQVRRHALLTLRGNAGTSPTSMSFWSQCLPAFLPEVLELTAGHMRLDRVDSLGFERERLVVLEEAAYRGAWLSAPAALAFGAGFPDHPFGRAVIGSEATIRRLDTDDIVDFARKRIQPANGVLIIEGPVDPEATLTLVRGTFATLTGDPAVPPLPPPPPAAPRNLIVDNSGHDGFQMGVVTRFPLDGQRDLVLLDLATSYLRRVFTGIEWRLLPQEAVLVVAWRNEYFEPGTDDWSGRSFDPEQDVQDSWAYFWRTTNDLIDDLADPEQKDHLQEWLNQAVAARSKEPLDRGTVGQAMVCGVSLPSSEEYNALSAGISLSGIREFLDRNLAVERTALAVSHGRDSGRNVGRRQVGRVQRDHEMLATDPLTELTAPEIGATLEAYRDAGLLRLQTLRLGNGVNVICRREPGADDWELSGWRRLEAVGEARAGKRPGICALYNEIVGFEPEPVTEERPLRAWRFDSTFELDPAGDFVFRGACERDSAASLAAALAGRLGSDRLNTSVWAYVRRWAPDRFAAARGRAENIAAAWRWGRILGPDHPALSRWAPESAMVDGLKFADLQKLHRRAAAPDGDLTLMAFGALEPDAVLAAVEPRFGRRGRCAPPAASPAPPGPDGIKGRVIFSPTETDVDLTIAFAAHRPHETTVQPGLTLLLLGELVTQALDSRLRQREGWTYSARCRMQAVGGWALPEITVTCQPGQAFVVFDLVREELGRLARGVTTDEFERARMRLVTDLLRSADDREALREWIRFVARFGPVPADPVAAALAIGAGDADRALAAVLPDDRLVFTATGAVLEDDLGQFDF